MKADLILKNGVIHTLDKPAQASALAAAGGRIVAIGSDSVVSGLAGRSTQVIDLGGRCVVPGMIDAHLHLGWFGLSLAMVSLDDAASLDDCLERVRVFPRTPAGWIRGSGWNHPAWRAPVLPDRRSPDGLAPDNPVILTRKDGHSIWVNTLALKLAGVNGETPDPFGGTIDRDPANGEPTGILRENAMDLVRRIVPAPGLSEIEQALLLAQERALAVGLTGVHTMEGADVFAALQNLERAGKLVLRVCQSIPKDNLQKAIALGLRSGFGSDRLRIGGVKLFADGSLGSATAAMLTDYEGQPGQRGVATLTKDELRELVGTACAAGIAPVTHAIGDRANRDVLDVYEEAMSSAPRPALPYRIEHVQLLQPPDVARLARLGVVASMQPIHCTSDRDTAARLWGERCRYAYAWRSLLEHGALLAFGSDCPVETLDPLAGIYAAVTRQRADELQVAPWYPQECLTPAQALSAYTQGAAVAAGEGAIKGTLAPGKLADMVVLAKDILAIASQEILTTEVEMTIVGGALVGGTAMQG